MATPASGCLNLTSLASKAGASCPKMFNASMNFSRTRIGKACTEPKPNSRADTTLVEAFDPDAMMGLADNEALHAIATDAEQRVNAAFAALNKEN